MRIAFYAPVNAPHDPTPSGDRLIGRQLWRGLEALGHEVVIASNLKSWSRDPKSLDDLKAQAADEVSQFHGIPFDAWFTYHVYYKAPDLIGPWIARAQGIPYFIAEASLSPKRADGPWAEHYALAREAIMLASRIFCISPRDRPALEVAGLETLVDLPPWVDAKNWQARARKRDGAPLGLVTTAMMRDGDKFESYGLIAKSLASLTGEWTLDVYGDGPAREKVEALFEPFESAVSFHGVTAQPALAKAYAKADLFLWPGLGEGLGMTYLEAQAAGLACIACDGPGPRGALDDGSARLTAATPEAFGWAIADLAGNKSRREAMGAAGRRLIDMRYSRTRFLHILKDVIEGHRP